MDPKPYFFKPITFSFDENNLQVSDIVEKNRYWDIDVLLVLRSFAKFQWGLQMEKMK